MISSPELHFQSQTSMPTHDGCPQTLTRSRRCPAPHTDLQWLLSACRQPNPNSQAVLGRAEQVRHNSMATSAQLKASLQASNRSASPRSFHQPERCSGSTEGSITFLPSFPTFLCSSTTKVNGKKPPEVTHCNAGFLLPCKDVLLSAKTQKGLNHTFFHMLQVSTTSDAGTESRLLFKLYFP